jgi:Fe-S oxidoreductase
VRRVAEGGADFYSSDCPMAGRQIESGLDDSGPQGPREPTHPLQLLRLAYGI